MIKRIIATTVALFGSITAFAQTDFLSISGDAASVALSGANAAYSTNYMSVAENMSAAATADETLNVGVSALNWQPSYLDSFIYQLGGYYKPCEKIAVGASYRFESLAKQDIINSAGDVDGSFRPIGMSVDLGAAYAINENLSVGASASYMMSKIYTVTNSFVGVNLSATYKIQNSAIAILADNLGAENEVISAPMSVGAAASHSLSIAEGQRLGIMAAGSYIMAPSAISSVTYSGGVEYGYQSKYFARAGYLAADPVYMGDYASLGLGAVFNSIKVDASYLIGVNNSPINGSFMIGLSWSK